ncbi:hypothetical protein T4A_12029, partial [Trichinella pseudospiralis]
LHALLLTAAVLLQSTSMTCCAATAVIFREEFTGLSPSCSCIFSDNS